MISQKRKKPKWVFISLTTLVIIVVLACLATALVLLFEYHYAHRYYPGVMIAGQSVGGKTYNEVLKDFTAKAEDLKSDGLTLVFEKENNLPAQAGKKYKKEIRIPAASSGFTPDTLVEYFSIEDLNGTITRAYNWGRRGSIVQRIKQQLLLVLGRNFNAPVSLRKEAIQSLVERETENLFAKPVPAQFSVDQDGKVIILAETLGDDLDAQKVTDAVLGRFNEFTTDPLVFHLQAQAPYTIAKKLEPFLDLATTVAASTGVHFYYKDHDWVVPGKTLVTWLTLKSPNKLTVDNTKLEAFLAKSAVPLIDNPPQNSRFQIKNGALVEISEGKPGNGVDIDKTVELMEGVISYMQKSFVSTGELWSEFRDATASILVVKGSKVQFDPAKNTVAIPIETITMGAQITQKTIDKYHINDLLGTAVTNFKGGSLDRQHNIEVGVSKMNGMLIAPGQEFSTIGAIGEVTEEAGFVKEFVINGEQTIKELGGGLCQVSTTLFRTVLKAGLVVTERVNHAYVIPYYGPGLDATIYEPHPDFRFVNDTENYILLQGTAKNNEVVFELYGVADGRTVNISEPELYNRVPVPSPRKIPSSTLPIGKESCTTATHEGITADVTYTVTYKDGAVKDRVFHSKYEAWPQVCLVGTALPR